jgi:hypothetical protein
MLRCADRIVLVRQQNRRRRKAGLIEHAHGALFGAAGVVEAFHHLMDGCYAGAP